ncbi:MAG: hypothetical protein OHK0013_30240 [Sandaracinaceae bacterium]
MRASLLVAFAMFLASSACGGTSPPPREPTTERRTPRSVDEALAQFPTRQRMNEIVRALPGSSEPPDLGPVVDRWEMEAASLSIAPGPFEPIAVALARGAPGLVSSTSARCAAREIARFVAVHGELPNTYLGDYLVGRCGSASLRASIAVRGFEVRGYDEGRLAREVSSDIVEGWRPTVAGQRGAIGVASARARDRIIVALVLDPERALRFALSAPPTPVEGRVRVEGTFDGTAEELLALISRGEADVAMCVTMMEGPRITVDCPFEVSDATAFVEVITREPGRLVPRTGARIVAVASPTDGLVYEERVDETARGSDPIAGVVAAVNAYRARLGRAPLALERAQSEANQESVSAFFATQSADVQEVAVLYAMAGWEVQGAVVGGNALAFEMPGGLEPGRWAAYILRHPFERYALLDPDVSRIAVGVREGPGVTRAMVSTYQLFGPADPEGERARVLAAIQRARAEANLPPIGLLGPVPALSRWASRITAGAVSPTDAMDAALREVGTVPGASSTMVLGVHDLDRWPVPRALLDARALDVAVAHYRPAGAAWGQYTVLVIFG